jgi:hypothetical protein
MSNYGKSHMLGSKVGSGTISCIERSNFLDFGKNDAL